jgi:transketolase
LYDGHSARAILDSFDWIDRQTEWPVAVLYNTHKGRWVSFMEDSAHWHGAPIDDASYASGRSELTQTLATLEARI